MSDSFDVRVTVKGSFNAQASSKGSVKGKVAIPYSAVLDPPIATTDTAGTIIVGDNLTIDETGRLSVDTTDMVEKDNTKPITSAAVDATVGNIAILLQTI